MSVRYFLGYLIYPVPLHGLDGGFEHFYCRHDQNGYAVCITKHCITLRLGDYRDSFVQAADLFVVLHSLISPYPNIGQG